MADAPHILWRRATDEHPTDWDARRNRYLELMREAGYLLFTKRDDPMIRALTALSARILPWGPPSPGLAVLNRGEDRPAPLGRQRVPDCPKVDRPNEPPPAGRQVVAELHAATPHSRCGATCRAFHDHDHYDPDCILHRAAEVVG